MSNKIILSKKGGFTLIELLVVISIIGMLSSVVMASVSQAREKGRISAGVLFEGNVYRGIGDTAVGRWTFDDLVEGGIASDTSGNNIGLPVITSGYMACSSPCRNVSTITPNNTGKSYFMDDTAYTAPMRKSAPNNVLNITVGTIGAWVKASPSQTNGNYGGSIIAAKCYNPGSWASYGLGLYNGYLAIKNGPGNYSSSWITGGPQITDDKWHYVAVSFNSTVANGSHMYIDGKMVNTFTFTGLNNGDGDLTVGFDPCTSGYTYGYLGYIDNLAIYNNVVTAKEIQQIYAEGLKSHQFASKR